jgi:hypothetical protein
LHFQLSLILFSSSLSLLLILPYYLLYLMSFHSKSSLSVPRQCLFLSVSQSVYLPLCVLCVCTHCLSLCFLPALFLICLCDLCHHVLIFSPVHLPSISRLSPLYTNVFPLQVSPLFLPLLALSYAPFLSLSLCFFPSVSLFCIPFGHPLSPGVCLSPLLPLPSFESLSLSSLLFPSCVSLLLRASPSTYTLYVSSI